MSLYEWVRLQFLQKWLPESTRNPVVPDAWLHAVRAPASKVHLRMGTGRDACFCSMDGS